MVCFRIPSKIGVPGVPGVPETLKATNGAAFSAGTPAQSMRNTGCSEHKWCSTFRALPLEHTQPPCSACRPVALRLMRCLPVARSTDRLWGVGAPYAL